MSDYEILIDALNKIGIAFQEKISDYGKILYWEIDGKYTIRFFFNRDGGYVYQDLEKGDEIVSTTSRSNTGRVW